MGCHWSGYNTPRRGEGRQGGKNRRNGHGMEWDQDKSQQPITESIKQEGIKVGSLSHDI